MMTKSAWRGLAVLITVMLGLLLMNTISTADTGTASTIKDRGSVVSGKYSVTTTAIAKNKIGTATAFQIAGADFVPAFGCSTTGVLINAYDVLPFQIFYNGAIDSVRFKIRGSMDGVHYYTLIDTSSAAVGLQVATPTKNYWINKFCAYLEVTPKSKDLTDTTAIVYDVVWPLK